MTEQEQKALEAIETEEWIASLDYVLANGGQERVQRLLQDLQHYAYKNGVRMPFTANTPYINSIPAEAQPSYPGSRTLERRIKSLIRWNAMAMVVRANRKEAGIGGHISTYASAATIYEVAFNHFFKARGEDGFSGDQIYFQGHAAPGIYARAFLEGRISEQKLQNFRRELAEGGGLSSYPHPWLMPGFWEFPTVSMGLGPIMAIYQARFNRYLEDRGIKPDRGEKVWAFLGDGETDEPETLGAISLAARAKLDNLIFVINANLQRLDGPVRGNGNIIQELERNFRGAGWNVIKVIWGSDWDALLEKDTDGVLIKRMGEVTDGDRQKYAVESGEYIRNHFFGTDPRLRKMVEHYSDERLQRLRLGGHDPEKIFAAFKSAVETKDAPTVILARTIKGYGLGEAGEGKNVTHQQKKLNEDELKEFRTRFNIPISDDDVADAPFYKPEDDSPEMVYLRERRAALGGSVPARNTNVPKLALPDEEMFREFYDGTDDREVSTTMAFVRMLTLMLKDKEIGKYVVPIVPDEARTFGMEALFRQVGIYSHVGQLYEPVDSASLLYYKEAVNGQILEEGITEAGSMASFIAAGTSYATHGIPMIPFFIYYSMFGMQRIGDLVWAAADMQARGFMIGGTAGRTTLAGEGLQHQDGNSHLLAFPVPNLVTYDPAFAYEVAVILQDGMRRMYIEQENVFYYMTVLNENYAQPKMPEGAHVKDGILKGLYLYRPSEMKKAKLHADIMANGSIMNEALKAREILEENYGVATNVWSATSYKQLHNDGLEVERWNRMHPTETPRVPYVTEMLKDAKGAIVAATDYVKALPDTICRWTPGGLISLGTDGFGRSEGRAQLRDFFEVDARFITLGVLSHLRNKDLIAPEVVAQAIVDLGIDPDKPNPMNS
ncbi:MAG: pyruvate dehydrogenase (acetyl-transferring), homodimeric type [Bacteroidota bacterium]|jgi:pyruvate dehydrogenase E1 component|nr:pyruvate dehydrogenase (acetyl-transferring), homodimeric type [Bacteroidota bacterium]